MLSWSIFFLMNAALAAIMGFSSIDSIPTGVARSLASVLFAIFLAALWIERHKRDQDV